MIRQISTALFCLFVCSCQKSEAQLTIQNGASLHMQDASQISVQGNFENAGAFQNNGVLKLQGNYTNTGAYMEGNANASFEIYGAGNTELNAGSSPIANLVINKTGASDQVKLKSTLVLSKSLRVTNGIFTTDPVANPSFSVTSPAAANYQFAPGKEIIGTVKKTGCISDTTLVFNQENMQIKTSGGNSPSEIAVTMIPQIGGGDPSQDEREVKRKYVFSKTGGGGFSADIRYPYNGASELLSNVEANLVPWKLTSSEWNASLNGVINNTDKDYVSISGIHDSAFSGEWKLADPNYNFSLKAFLKGAWKNISGTMTTALNAGGLLPLRQPFASSPFLYAGTESIAAIPNANIVDWVLIECRKPASGLAPNANASTVIGRKAAFLLQNGTIADLNGTSPVLMTISKQGPGNYIVLKHRNHLAVMSTAKASSNTGTFSNDFSALANVYQKPTASSAPMCLLASSIPGNTLYGLWPGDANANGNVGLDDVAPINIAIAGPTAANSNVYSTMDMNLDKHITAADVSVTRTAMAGFAQTSTSKMPLSNSTDPNTVSEKVELTTHVRENIKQ